MTCPDSRQLLRLLGGESPPEAQLALRAHLAGCEPCRRSEAELRATWDVLGEWSTAAGPSDLVERVLAAAEAPPGGQTGGGVLLRFMRLPSVRAAASVALAAGLGIAVGRFSAGPRQPAASADGAATDEVMQALGVSELASLSATGLPDLFSPATAEEDTQP